MLCKVKVKEAELPDGGEKLRFLKVFIKGRRRQEETTPLSGQSPTFDQDFSFTYPSRDTGKLRVSLYEKNDIGIDPKLASGLIPLDTLEDNVEKDDWFPLTAKDGSDVGKVHLSLTICPTEEVSEEDEADFLKGLEDGVDVDLPDEITVPEVSEHPTDEKVQETKVDATPSETTDNAAKDIGSARIQVTIVEANGITSTGNEGLVDPYCTVQITSHRRRAKTKVLHGTASPSWNQTFVFHVAHTIDESITILLKDKEEEGAEVLGRLVVPLSEVGEKRDEWWPIEPVMGRNRGKMHLVIAVEATDEASDDDPAQYDVQSEDEDEDSLSEEEDRLEGAVKVFMKVEIVEAKGLEKGDMFCRVRVSPRTRVCDTKVVKDAEKPEWKEQFAWHLVDYTQNVLELEVFSGSAVVGSAQFPLVSLTRGVFDDWIALIPPQKDAKGGKVKVRILMDKTDDESEDAPEEEEVVEVVLEDESVVGAEEEDAFKESVKKPRNKKERLCDTARAYNKDPKEVESRARELAEERYKGWTKRIEGEFNERPGLKNHRDRIIFNNAKELEKEKQAREDPNQMTKVRLVKETEKCERERDDVDAEIEQLRKEVQEMANTE